MQFASSVKEYLQKIKLPVTTFSRGLCLTTD